MKTLYIGTAGIATGPHVYINMTSWNMDGENGAVDLKAMTALVLHEIGHVYNDLIPQGSGGSQIIQNDGNNVQIGANNDQLIYRLCYP
jgi:hypothetical protein